MNKAIPYIIGGAILILAGIMIVSRNFSGKKSFNERITLRQKDKLPYGTSAAKDLLPAVFPGTEIVSENKSPGNWQEVSQYTRGQAVLMVSKSFYADEYELAQMMRFVKEGNYVFIVARDFSEETQQFFGFQSVNFPFEEDMGTNDTDSLLVSLEIPSYKQDTSYSYPGRAFEGWTSAYDTSLTVVLGRNKFSKPNFLRFNAGDGAFFIHMAPITFSNYFILHKQNSEYFRKALSVIPGKPEKLAWNEYYLLKPAPKPKSGDKSKNVFAVLMRYASFRYGLLTAIALLGLFLLMEMRRRQRMIPLHPRPRNETLDFVKTMGRLYHDKRDHGNLAKKMSIYFLEHVRSQYKLPTHELNDDFINALHYKSGYPAESIGEIISFVRFLQQPGSVNEKQLATFHRQLESFYQNT